MKKIFLMLSLAIAPALFLTSCSDDDDPTMADYARGTYAVTVEIEGLLPEEPENPEGPDSNSKMNLKDTGSTGEAGETAEDTFNLVLSPAGDLAVDLKMASFTWNELEFTNVEAKGINLSASDAAKLISIEQNISVSLIMAGATEAETYDATIAGSIKNQKSLALTLEIELFEEQTITVILTGDKK